jgi:FAD/FMN-containing dehydrogenase
MASEEATFALKRRDLIRATGALALMPLLGCPRKDGLPPNIVNDIHSQLNQTQVDKVVAPSDLAALQAAISDAATRDKPICIAGARHAMGGQQFATDSVLIDTRELKKVINFDTQKGLVRAEAGIAWPELVNHLVEAQDGQAKQWGISQKQTGADRLCLGGALSANVHGRGLKLKPLISDIESFEIIDAKGTVRTCSRTQHPELFRLAIGGYGLFGVISTVTLRLAPRRKVQRETKIITLDGLMDAFAERIASGYIYGDFQFMTDEKSGDYLRRGVFSCYCPVDINTPIPEDQKQVSERAWNELVYLAHTDKARVYQLYADYYMSSSGQVYWSDTHQLGAYLEDYHKGLDRRMKSQHPATEVITEIYVPRKELGSFMAEAAADFRKHNVNIIYGTIRLIERDTESFLAWAKQNYACVIFNVHTEHTPQGREHSAQAFRRLIDMAIRRGGSYYLTYHRHTTKKQVEACYPQFTRFLKLKQRYDPDERFQSDWYRHYKRLFAAELKQA